MSFFDTYLFNPIYNLLIFLVAVVPGGDVGLAVIAATLIIKILLTPLSFAALRTQKAVKIMEPELKEIREAFKDDKERQAKELLSLYKKYGVNPLASIATLLIQIPVLIALYFVFIGETLPNVEIERLYSFITIPEVISPLFLGIFAVSGSSFVLAGLAGITQFFQAWLAIPVHKKKEGETASMQEEFGRAMALQARFVLPFIIALVAFTSGAVALYFITSNIVGVLQELYARRRGFSASEPSS